MSFQKLNAAVLTVALGLTLGAAVQASAHDSKGVAHAKEAGRDMKKSAKKAGNDVSDAACETVNGKVDCAGKKAKHKMENAAEEVKK